MLTAFCVSIVFLACYLIYHACYRYQIGQGMSHFRGRRRCAAIYVAILITHVVLAATVPVLAGVTIYLGYRDRRDRNIAAGPNGHFRSGSTSPITGVVIYLMLYHLYPHRPEPSAIK